jgi:hypothetical protein
MKFMVALVLLIAGGWVYWVNHTRDAKALHGRWAIVSMPDGWVKVPTMDVMVTSDEIRIRVGAVVTKKLSYTADPARQTIDAAPEGEAPRLGIYRIAGDTLTLSVAAEGKARPINPDSSEDGAMKWVLQRGNLL